MRIILKTFVTFSVALLVVLLGVFTTKNVFKDDFSEKIEINKTDKIYNSTQEIIVTGKSNPETEIFLSWAGKIALIDSDKKGNWIANLGIMQEGKYGFQAVSKGPENSQSIATTQIIVKNIPENEESVGFSINLVKNFLASMPFSFKNIPDNLNAISQFTPPILRGDWKLIN